MVKSKVSVKVKLIQNLNTHTKEGNPARSLKFDDAGKAEGVWSEKI